VKQMKTKFLWIEDNATTDLKHMLMPVFTSGKFDPIIALNVTDGFHRMLQMRFDAVIVDIRMLPGNDPDWINLYNQWGKNKGSARLGLRLLFSLLKPQPGDIVLEKKPKWVRPELFGVLTVEGKDVLEGELDALDIHVYEQKTARTPKNILVDMVERIVAGGSTR
jgi:hypothetical protein